MNLSLRLKLDMEVEYVADWNSVQYLKFKSERTQPAIDLINRINIGCPEKIIDIGCGPGNSTQVLAERFPKAYILGIDNSCNMIASAKKNYPALDFRLVDAGTELSALDNDFDIVFSNACIQWIPHHGKLIRDMLRLLKRGGVLAVQIPMNYDEPIHRIIGEVCSSNKWKSNFMDTRIFYTLTQSEYFDILSEDSEDVEIWETTYYHVMTSCCDILEWYRGTGLRPYLNVLSDDKKPEFESDIMKLVESCYPKQKNGKILFRFPRFFFTAKA